MAEKDMAEAGRVPPTPVDAGGARFLIIEARFYDAISTMLLEGATHALEAAGASVEVVTVPGCLELPVTLALMLDREAHDGVVALGCIIRGETYHFEIVANESARALTQLVVDRRIAFGNGILAVENEYQAIARADPMHGNKGGAAAQAALALWQLKKDGPLTKGAA